MSVLESDKIDGIALSDGGKGLILLITDHLDFEDEYNHLLTLQEKINSYLGFIESKQYCEIYPNSNVGSAVIKIHFKYKVTENCRKFVDLVNAKSSELNTTCVIVEC